MIKVALVGIGGMGGVHFGAYKTIEGAQVVAVADVRVDMAREKVAGTEAKVYASLDELLAAEKVDVVDICTPSYMHTEHSIKALEAGCHVLCEKPMSVSTEDTARVIETAKRAGKFFMTAHVVRFMQPYIYLREVIESGELGKVVHIDMKRISGVPRWSWEDWMRDVKKSGGTPIDLSIHDLDFARDVFGEPVSVNAIYSPLKNNNDYIVSNLVYDGFSVTVTGAWYNADIAFCAEYLAVFENGTLELKAGKVYKNGEEVSLVKEKREVSEDTGINIPRADGYADEIEYFITCVENGMEPSRVTPESSEGTVRMVGRIIENSIIIK